MTQDIRFSRAVSALMVAPIQTSLDGGSGAMKVKIYDGTRPATPETGITTQTLLVQASSSNTTTCATQSGGTLTFDAFPVSTAEAFTSPSTRTAGWCRWVDSAGVACFDTDIGLTGSGKFVTLPSLSIVAGAPVLVATGGTITMP